MAQFEEQNPLDYRAGGDTVDDFAQKYMKEIARIYQFLNNVREHNSTGPNQVEPQPYMFKVTDNKLFIRNSANNAWLYLFDITYRMGMSDNPDAVILTSDDVTTTAEALKLVKTNSDGDIDADITGNAYKFGNKTADQYVIVDDVSDAGAALKIVKTDSDGVAHVSISGSAAQLNGKAASYYLNEDDLATVPSGAAVTTDANKVVKTNANGLLPVNITGNAAKIAGIVSEINNLQDGQVLTYRIASNSWRNEDKGVVGAGKALAIYDGDTLLAEYSGDAPISIDLAKHNRIASTAYTVGTCANHDTLPAGWYLECTTAGTSDSSNLTITSPTVGGTVTDGTVVWTIRNAASKKDISDLNSRIDLVNSIAARDTAVSLGDTAMLEGLPAGYFLECTTAGTTDSTAPVVTQPVSAGQTINDGTAVWTVRQCETTVFKDSILSVGLSHNGIYRGKNLGTWSSLAEVEAFLTAHKVSTGEFEDLYIGDYVTIQDGTYNKEWEIAGFDHYWGKGDTALTTHHIAFFPKESVTLSYMNSGHSTTGAYANSYMHTTTIPTVNTNLASVLGSHLLTRRALLSSSMSTSLASMAGAGRTGASNDSTWTDVKACLPSEVEIYGSMIASSSLHDVNEACNILPLFNFKRPNLRGMDYWLKAVCDKTDFCYVYRDGRARNLAAGSLAGVCPIICVG